MTEHCDFFLQTVKLYWSWPSCCCSFFLLSQTTKCNISNVCHVNTVSYLERLCFVTVNISGFCLFVFSLRSDKWEDAVLQYQLTGCVLVIALRRAANLYFSAVVGYADLLRYLQRNSVVSGCHVLKTELSRHRKVLNDFCIFLFTVVRKPFISP